MRTIIDFRVEPSLPEPLAKLKELAYNMWWTWNPEAIQLFQRMDEQLWTDTNNNPVLLLGTISQENLESLAKDTSFLEFLEKVHQSFTAYMKAQTWYSANHGKTDAPIIAYFSMEYGLAECLPIYSGGLGVLSGDTLKSVSDLGIPMASVGLLYQEGYFEQYLNIDGWQQEKYPMNDFYNLPITQVMTNDTKPLKVSVDLAGREVMVQVWRCDVGRIPLFLLDTNLPENTIEDQEITDQLYGGDNEMRIKQEIILGIGGMRALAAMGIRPLVCHINEGHAAFMALERIRLLMKETGLSFRDAKEATGGGNVFTTHTPVPAGFDLFSTELMKKYFENYAVELGLGVQDIIKMGRRRGAKAEERFNMAIMALSNATFINAVSKLHQQVTREMVIEGFPEVPQDEIPIDHVTNGIHLRTWISRDMSELFNRYIGSAWINQPVQERTWKGIMRIPDTELWRTHERRRERLVSFSRKRLGRQIARRGASVEEVHRAAEVLNPEALTIGFARRFATYKRATLLLSEPERLVKILTNPKRPVQLIFAGKAHPHDDAGKEFIKKIIHFARDERVRDHIVFLENYNLAVGRYLVQGVDVWLNTPKRPMEASGTSGMKVAANGGLNLSVLDGWWDEGYNSDVGWAIGGGEEYKDSKYQDEVESNALYGLLEQEIVPVYYDRGRDGLPRKWIAKMKASMSQLTPVFNTDRMMREYNNKFYIKAKDHFNRLSANDFEKAKKLADWKINLKKKWMSVRIESVQADCINCARLKVGETMEIESIVKLGELSSEHVQVEMYVGQLDESRIIREGKSVKMDVVEDMGDGRYLYSGVFVCNATGYHGLGVRVMPFHPDLATKYEMALILWAG